MTQAARIADATFPAIGIHEFVVGALPMRTQPPHEAHIGNIVSAKTRCDVLVLLLGSSNMARSYKNPLTFEERKRLFEECFPQEVASGELSLIHI